MDLVTIIVPVYNVENYLNRCLDSIIKQSYKNLDIILINDGSTDNSLKICNNYAKNDTRITVINIENSGPSICRNIGLEKAKGGYISFVDSDDYIEKNFIETLLKTKKIQTLMSLDAALTLTMLMAIFLMLIMTMN